MRHDQAGDAAASQGVIDIFLCRGIEGAGRLVQNEDCRIAHQCAGDLQPLPLAAAEIRPAFLDRGRVSERPEQDFVMDAGISRRSDDHFIRNGRIPQGDVVAHSRGEQHDLLIHHGNGPPKHFVGNVIPQMAIKQDFARPRPIDTRNQMREGRLAGAAGTDHRNALSRLDREIEILDQGWPALVETEGDVSQFELARKLEPAVEGWNRFGFRTAAAEDGVFSGLGDVLESLQIGRQRLAFIGKLKESPDGRQKHLCQDIQPDQRPQGHVSSHDPTGPDAQDRRAAKCGDQAWKRAIDMAQFGIALPRLQFARLLAAPARKKPVIRSCHAQVVRMTQHLHADADQQSLFTPHRLASNSPKRAEEVDQHAVQEGQQQHNQREHDIVGQHRDEQYRAHRHVDNEHKKLSRQILRDSVDGRDPIGQIADQPVGEELDRQPKQP